jgi:hypothetical protein
MESYTSGYGRVANSCGYGNEHAGSIENEKFLSKLRDCTLLKGYAQWRQLLQLNKLYVFRIHCLGP